MRLYDRLCADEDPMAAAGGRRLLDSLNPGSLTVLHGCKLEPCLAGAEPGDPIQFERIGYFTPDPDGSPGKPVFNRTVGLRDTWAKEQKRG